MKHWLRWKAVINPRPESSHSFNMLTLSSRQNCGKNERWTSGSKSRAVCHWLSVKQWWKTAFSIKTSTVAESKYVCSPGWAVETSGKKPRCRSAQFSLNIFTYWHVWASLGTDDTKMMKSWTLNNQWIRANHIWVSIFFFFLTCWVNLGSWRSGVKEPWVQTILRANCFTRTISYSIGLTEVPFL